MKTLGGAFVVCDGLKYNYPFLQAIQSLESVCDQVAVIMFSPEDIDTFEKTYDFCIPGTIDFFQVPRNQWDVPDRGRFRIDYWQNEARKMLTTDWYFSLEADEIIHEACYPAIREAIEKDAEAYTIRRFNLWGDPYHTFNVPKEKQPCGDMPIRLAKTKYRCNVDLEGIEAPASNEYLEAIRIYHMGFVRDRKVMNAKIKRMAGEIYGQKLDPNIERDEKENGGIFRPETRYPREVLKPIQEPLPAVIQSWAKERAYGAINPFEEKS